MCQGLVFVYACRHRQVGEVRICLRARQSASNAGCLASLTFMLTGKEPSRQCGDVKTSRRYLMEPCLACRIQADMGGNTTAVSPDAFPGNFQNGERPVSPPAESGAFSSDPSRLVTRPYVGDLMSTAASSAATVAVAVAMPRPVVVAKSRSDRGRRSSSAGPSSGPRSDSRSGRPETRGRTMTPGSSSGPNSSRSRSTSRGRAAVASSSANNLPASRTSGRRSNSAARRFATADRLSTVQEDAIPMVPMIPTNIRPAIGRSGAGSSSSSARVAPPRPARLAANPPRATVAPSSPSFFSRKDVKGKGKETEKQTKNKTKENTKSPKTPKTPKSSTSSSSRSPTFSERDRSIRSTVANSGPAASLGLGVYRYSAAHRHAASGLSSGSAAGRVPSYAGPSFSNRSPTINPRRSPPRNISDRLRSMKKVAKSEESLVCADAARIEGKGNFF